ncbi:uncharacterized protein LOC106673048 [Cimex lectularius]|uniref:Uncharacterized protein n=1 Tax=Cimex lectularius TaxID=79782 RepID=A0A8I6TKT2_CIMLE|nr:uncharacterized protein LOC106673048 [Cimex lectularius]
MDNLETSLISEIEESFYDVKDENNLASPDILIERLIPFKNDTSEFREVKKLIMDSIDPLGKNEKMSKEDFCKQLSEFIYSSNGMAHTVTHQLVTSITGNDEKQNVSSIPYNSLSSLENKSNLWRVLGDCLTRSESYVTEYESQIQQLERQCKISEKKNCELSERLKHSLEEVQEHYQQNFQLNEALKNLKEKFNEEKRQFKYERQLLYEESKELVKQNEELSLAMANKTKQLNAQTKINENLVARLDNLETLFLRSQEEHELLEQALFVEDKSNVEIKTLKEKVKELSSVINNMKHVHDLQMGGMYGVNLKQELLEVSYDDEGKCQIKTNRSHKIGRSSDGTSTSTQTDLMTVFNKKNCGITCLLKLFGFILTFVVASLYFLKQFIPASILREIGNFPMVKFVYCGIPPT